MCLEKGVASETFRIIHIQFNAVNRRFLVFIIKALDSCYKNLSAKP